MMRVLIIIIASCWMLGSCAQSTSDSTEKKLLVKLSATTGVNENQKTIDSVYTVETDYFEISLYLLEGGSGFMAQQEIEKPTSMENFRYKRLYVVDASEEPREFTTSTDFLNYMAERGYQMQDQEKFEYRTDYIFKRK